jgi:succinyl-CoA synthetase beta subunit
MRNIHAHQAKEILRKYGVAVLNGKVAFTPEEAEAATKELGRLQPTPSSVRCAPAARRA